MMKKAKVKIKTLFFLELACLKRNHQLELVLTSRTHWKLSHMEGLNFIYLTGYVFPGSQHHYMLFTVSHQDAGLSWGTDGVVIVRK